MSFPAVSNMMTRDIYNESATKKCMLGTVIQLNDGRKYAYAKAGAAGLAVGKLMQSAITAADHVKDMVVAANAAIGATSISVTVTSGGTAVTKDQFKDGFLFVNDATGEGQCRRIKSNTAAAAAAATTITLYNDEPLTVALVASTSEVGLVVNPYNGVLVSPTTLTGLPIGVTPIAVTANYYFWLQISGICACLTSGTVVVGMPVYASTDAAGAVGPDAHIHVENAATAYTQSANTAAARAVISRVGICRQVAATTEYSLIQLQLG